MPVNDDSQARCGKPDGDTASDRKAEHGRRSWYRSLGALPRTSRNVGYRMANDKGPLQC